MLVGKFTILKVRKDPAVGARASHNQYLTAGTWQPLPIASLGNGPLRDPWADPATAFAAAPRQPAAPAPLGIGGAATLTTALPLPGFGPSSVWR